MLFFVQRTFTFYPSFTIFIGVGETATPVAQVWETFIFEGNPVDFIVIEGDEMPSA